MNLSTDVVALRAAFAYFSIIPVGHTAGPDARALAWLPVVGAVLGALAGVAALAVDHVAPHAIAVAVAFGATIVLTGAIHLDGFLDACDALFVSANPERRLLILKDPCHGTFALAGLAVAAPLWLAALWDLSPATYPLALAFAAASSRWSVVLHAARAASPRTGATTAALAVKAPRTIVALGGLIVVALAVIFGLRGAAATVASMLAAAAALSWGRTRLGGHLPGDVYGFAITIAEITTLLMLGS
jgi:adenosylcobinamide-GDP ribazoletransferase